jgi:hypothetical protein
MERLSTYDLLALKSYDLLLLMMQNIIYFNTKQDSLMKLRQVFPDLRYGWTCIHNTSIFFVTYEECCITVGWKGLPGDNLLALWAQ